MKIDITPEMALKDIQTKFNLSYPFLKIEFLKNHQAFSRPNSRVEKLNPLISVINAGNTFKQFQVDIHANRKVMQVEDDFMHTLGLRSQVLRKSGKVWIETTLTSDWSLQRQNEEGRLISEYCA